MMSEVYNPFEHHHHHHDDDDGAPEAFDPAQESLADALRVSFWILKFLMIIVVIIYVFSNWFNVDQQYVAVKLRFGKIVGQTPKTQVLPPGGPHLALPVPFDQVIEISTMPRTINLDREFWWFVTDQMNPDVPQANPLNPMLDGSLLTADANIIHARWSITYQIKRNLAGQVDPDAVIQYVENVGREETAEQIVRATAEQAIVKTAAVTLADDMMKSRFDRAAAEKRIQSELDRLSTGLAVSQVAITSPRMPGAVADAYQAVTLAVAEKGRLIDEARKERDEILLRAAGQAHRPLWRLIQAYEQAHAGQTPADKQRSAAMLSTLDDLLRKERIDADDAPGILDLSTSVEIGGQIASVINQAVAYKTNVIKTAEREVEEFIDLLPEYRTDPKLFMAFHLATTIEDILTSKKIQTHYIGGEVQVYVESNPDPEIERSDEVEGITTESEEEE